MAKRLLTAFYGGTFDPIHNGHLQPVIALAKLVNLKRVIILPNKIPLHRKQPQATPNQRLMMTRLAIADTQCELFIIDERELHSPKPSLTVETFKSIRREYGPIAPIGLIIGQDSLLTLPQWHRSQELLELCHIIVCTRPCYQHYSSSYLWIENRLTNDPTAMCYQPAGLVYCAATPALAISASEIRWRLHAILPCCDLLTPSVQGYILEQGLYR
ncbi:nicotinate-nucleotide adenylyltransferase [Candidatus Palibaumannia cicadellinicola]|uniref:Probable nicotinate-nucleotide adenylyltransferase n=1 Tax=Candidatus Palibaumannia cicadellinicola TaxID=186490 RepID=A0A0K2BK50_9GAMM|nr:nicotinate-nucleotide adenylyltransferase [Candidatus Baumannia cicadellinicola]AKZ65801.1 Nicotinate-nucleotide adenylyltransferase [Candidatus Baumannia cicadellinicola]